RRQRVLGIEAGLKEPQTRTPATGDAVTCVLWPSASPLHHVALRAQFVHAGAPRPCEIRDLAAPGIGSYLQVGCGSDDSHPARDLGPASRRRRVLPIDERQPIRVE